MRALPCASYVAAGLSAVLLASSASGMCDVIPGVTQQFRGALGSLNRPFAIANAQGDELTLRLDATGCDAGSPGFADLPGGVTPEDDYFVTILFVPPDPAAPRHAVVLSTPANRDACRAALPAGGGVAGSCATADELPDPISPSGFSIRRECVGGTGAGQLCTQDGDCASGRCEPRRLVLRFPDTDALVGTPDDDRTLTGPVTIAVTPSSDPLPFDLASVRCADRSGLTACVDELYARDGTCETDASHVDPTFGHLTALPPPNNYQALCTTPDTPCEGVQDEVRFSVDTSGNALVPMDYGGVLIDGAGVPIPRLILGNTDFEAFAGSGVPVDIPSDAFVASFAPGGQRLPPIFTPVANPEAAEALGLFGSVDAPVGVIRVQRRGCVGGTTEGAPCSSDAGCGGAGTCTTLFDFSDRLADGVGPVLIPDGQFTATAQNPVPLEGLIESPSVFAFVASEAIDGEHLNDDGDATDPVLRIRDRRTGSLLPIGTHGAGGRAVARIDAGRFRLPGVVVRDDVVAFLELEPLEGNRDANGNGSVFDPILRVYRLSEDCGSGTACVEDLTASLPTPLAVDAAPLVEGRSLAISNGRVYFRIPEWRQARQVTELVSVASDGTRGSADSLRPSVSADGEVVAFSSDAPEFADRDGNETTDVFVRDRAAGQTSLVSGTPGGDPGTGQSRFPSLSADGQVVSFQSEAADLVEGDTNGVLDIFVHDRPSGETERVSVDSDGYQANGISGLSFLSEDAEFVAFQSLADDLVPDDMNQTFDIFVHDRSSGATERVSVDSGGMEGNGASGLPSISPDGRIVVFHSLADNLGPGEDVDTSRSVFLHDRATGETLALTVGAEGGPVKAADPSFSSNGRFVAFDSPIRDLVPGDTNARADVFLRDLATGTTRIASVASDGTQANDRSRYSDLSSDGRLIAFQSAADNLVPDDTNGKVDIFVHDRLTRATERASIPFDPDEGVPALALDAMPSISADGRVVAFVAGLETAVPGEAQARTIANVFVRGPDERDSDADLSGDGDVRDTVLAALDLATGQLSVICPADQVSLDEDASAAFLHPLDAGPCGPGAGASRSEEGSAGSVVQLFVPDRGVVDLGRPAVAVALSRELVGALVGSDPGATQVQVYDRARDAWVDSGEVGDTLAVAGTTLVFTTPENDAGGDLNGDGDVLDRVLRIYRLEDGALVPVPQASLQAVEDFVLGDRIVALRTREASQGQDLNRDGDLDDDVLQVFDLVSERLFDTEQAVTPCPVEACDPRFPYRVAGDTVTFVTSELKQAGPLPAPGCESTGVPGECDLNGDGDGIDLVKQIFNAREAARLVPPDQGAAGCVDAIASASTGICTSSGEACASDSECGMGTCYVPPGSCIADLGTPCRCSDDECTGCGPGEFCGLLDGGDEGTCRVDEEIACSSQAECGPTSRCEDVQTHIQAIFSPVGEAGASGHQAIFSAGRCMRSCETCPGGQKVRGTCRVDDDCDDGFACARQVVIASAADADSDGLADPYDNCPDAPNIEQADLDGDGVGDACDLMTCGNRVRESSEACDDGNRDDGDGCSAACELENHPPDCGAALASPEEVWPPTLDLVPISIGGVTDPDGDALELTIAAIRQDEPVAGDGAGETCPDAGGVGSDRASVRAELADEGDGRVYHVEFQADDGRGGHCSAVVAVCVPRDRYGRPGKCRDQGPLFDSTRVCASDSGGACGIGFELALLLPGLAWLRERRRRARAMPVSPTASRVPVAGSGRTRTLTSW